MGVFTAVQVMQQAKAGFEAMYLSGWLFAADGNSGDQDISVASPTRRMLTWSGVRPPFRMSVMRVNLLKPYVQKIPANYWLITPRPLLIKKCISTTNKLPDFSRI